MRRRLLVVVGIVILAGGAASAYYVAKHQYGGNVRGSSSGFSSTQIAPPPRPGPGVVWPMFGAGPERLHVGPGHVRPPFRRDWTTVRTALVEFPPALAFQHLYYATLAGDLVAVSTRNGKRLWTVHVGRCEAAGPAVNSYRGGTVFETFLNRRPCGVGVNNPADGLLLAIGAGRPHKVRWRRNLGASETSPLIVGGRLYIGTADGDVYCLHADDGKTIWHYHVAAPVKSGLAYDRGKVFFGAYDGNLYALNAGTGKLLWSASSARDWTGGHGRFYSTPAVEYSRVYIGSTDGKVYAFDERNGKLAWAHGTGGYVYASPAVYDGCGCVLIGSYSHTFYALNAATGDVEWTFLAPGPISGSATVVDGIVYFATSQRTATITGHTYALNARTGTQLWSLAQGGYAPIVTDGQKLYVGGWGKIYAFSPRRHRHR